MSLGTEVNILPAAIEAVRARGGLVIAQLNPRVPYTYGDAVLPCDAIDYAIEAEAPLPSPPERPVDGNVRRHRRPGGRAHRRRRDAAGRHRRGPRRRPGRAAPQARAGRLVGDVQRRRARPGQGGRAGPGPAGHRVVRVRQRGPLRLAGPQPGRADAADRDGERPGADRPAAADDLGQQRAPGRPVRAGQRDLGRRAGSTPGSAGRPTSWSARCTPRAARRSSRCRPGTPRRTCPPWCPGSTGR